MEDIKVLKDFLEKAKDLEVSIYTQNRIISGISQKINNLDTKAKTIALPDKIPPLDISKLKRQYFMPAFLKGAMISTVLIIG